MNTVAPIPPPLHRIPDLSEQSTKLNGKSITGCFPGESPSTLNNFLVKVGVKMNFNFNEVLSGLSKG